MSAISEYLRHWQFWAAVLVVALVINWAYGKYAPGKGKLV